MEKGIWVKIINYEKYKGRSDVKHNSWFRCSNRLLEDPDFYDFSHTELWVWIYMLSLASQKDVDTVFLNFDHADRVARLKKTVVLSALEKLYGNQIDPVDVPPTVRERDVDGTDPCATRQDRQDRQDRIEPVVPTKSSLCPPLALVWNQELAERPKLRSWSEPRGKKFKAILRDHGESGWREVLEKIKRSDFLLGKTENEKWNGATFDWVLKPENFLKIIEGNYDNQARRPDLKVLDL